MDTTVSDDKILPVTRVVAAIVIPFLVLAFLILYFFPHLSGQHFSWEIKPSIMAVYMGAGYIGGAFLFFHTLIGKQWHRVTGGFLAVSSFTLMMLLTTILHWSRFDIRHFPFQLWLILYIVTPVLIPWLWLRNRTRDPQSTAGDDIVVSVFVRYPVRFLGLTILLVSLAGFIRPDVLIQVWPWTLTPLLARILAGWGVLLAVGNLVISGEPRWSSWRVAVGSIAIWHVLYLAGSIVHRADFIGGAWLNWYNISVIAILLGVFGLFIWMEQNRKRI